MKTWRRLLGISEGPRKPRTFHMPVEGCLVRIQEGVTDLYGRTTTQVIITPANVPAGENVWRLRVPRQDRKGPLIVNISQLKTVTGKEAEGTGGGIA